MIDVGSVRVVPARDEQRRGQGELEEVRRGVGEADLGERGDQAVGHEERARARCTPRGWK